MTQEEYLCNYERRVQAYEHRKYQNILTIFEEEYDFDEAILCSLDFLLQKLDLRIKILERVRELYRKHNLENLRNHERESFIKQNIKRGRIFFMDWRAEERLFGYPYYKLNINRLKKSAKELQYLEKWELKYIPEWVSWSKGDPPYYRRNHSSGVIIQFLGEDGEYSVYNSYHYETKYNFYL